MANIFSKIVLVEMPRDTVCLDQLLYRLTSSRECSNTAICFLAEIFSNLAVYLCQGLRYLWELIAVGSARYQLVTAWE